MSPRLDHLILHVNSIPESVAFYTQVLEFEHLGERPPFAVLRVSPDLVIQLAPWRTGGGEHLAFALPRAAFDRIFQRTKDRGIPYGDRFDGVGNLRGPAEEEGARGVGQAVYFFDPNQHLIEIRYYADELP